MRSAWLQMVDMDVRQRNGVEPSQIDVGQRGIALSGFRAVTSWMVEQLGLAMMLRLRQSAKALGLTSGTTKGTSGSMLAQAAVSTTIAITLKMFFNIMLNHFLNVLASQFS